jgi:hypothetical protein
MKSLIILVIATITLNSCKKDYTCSCKIPTGPGTQHISNMTWEKQKKSDAEKQCQEAEESLNSGPYQPYGPSTCEIK